MLRVEDYIEILAGIKPGAENVSLDKPDYNLITSLARQTFRGQAYTDRQFLLAKNKVLFYKQQLLDCGFAISEPDLNDPRMPIREIDRSRWIKIVPHPKDVSVESEKTPFLAVRFVFNKKLINVIDTIRSTDRDAHYDKKEKIHYFSFTEKNVYNIMNALRDKNFQVDKDIQDIYEELIEMKNNKKNYIPGIYNFKLENFNKTAIDFMISDIGSPNKDNLHLFVDRQKMYGIEHIDEDDVNNTIMNLLPLSQRIIKRTKTNIYIDSKEFNFDRLAESLLELNRLPMLIILEETTDYDVLVKTYNTFKNILSEEDFSVLYRKENDSEDNKEFNNYIKRNKLNTPLDKLPKIVYTSKNKLPKTLLKSNWSPRVALYFGAKYMITRTNNVSGYVSDLDFVIHYNSNYNQYAKYEMDKIEKI